MERESIYSTASSRPSWDGEEVWLLGSGPSAAGFDLGKLRGRRILCVNDAAARALLAGQTPTAAVFSLDPQWVLRRRSFLTAYPGDVYLALPLDTFPGCAGIPGAVYLQWAHGSGLSDDPRYINTGGHSGYGAFGLAYLKGARRIFLIGYDLDPQAGGAWSSQFKFWAANYRNTVSQLSARGVEVFNCNPQSVIDAFPYIDPDSALYGSRGDRGLSYQPPGPGNRI